MSLRNSSHRMSEQIRQPHVSIVVPTYNHADFLDRALKSIQAQTFADWEAIVVDDGSTDETVAVVSQFADDRIQYIYQDNRGLSAARNTGIEAARGYNLAFLDADDEWEPDFLRRCAEVLAADSVLAGVYTRNYFIDEQGRILPQIGGEVVPRSAFRSRLLDGGFFPCNAVLVRAKVVHQVGLFDVQLTSVEDRDLWLRISEHYRMEGIPDVLARYRVYPGSMSTDVARMLANRIAILVKHLGSPEGDPATWPKEKRRAYALAYRAAALAYIQQSQLDEAECLLQKAVFTYPQILERLDTFYELACSDQPRGYRGAVTLMDIDRNGVRLLEQLDSLFEKPSASVAPLRRMAYGNAYLALGILNDQAGRWAEARRYLIRAVLASPGLMICHETVRRFIKLLAGKRLVRIARLINGLGQ